MDKNILILVGMNIILMILCSLLLVKLFTEETPANSVPAVPRDLAIIEGSETRLREEKVSSALGKLPDSDEEPKDPMLIVETNVSTYEPFTNGTKLVEQASGIASEDGLSLNDKQDLEGNVVQLTKAQALYQEKAEAYKKSLRAN